MRPARTIALNLRDNEHCKRLRDPFSQSLYHLETLLPFSEAAKLERGNANVRPPADRKPLKNMLETVKEAPQSFHLKNRGITYLCERFEFDNAKRSLTVTIPKGNLDDLEESGTKFGIGDGGELQAPLARVVIGGLLASTIVTLVLVPAVYTLFEEGWKGLSHKGEAASH